MGEYHDLYCKFDVLILADVFEHFRKTGKEYYNLDPVHYFSCPGFAWDAMLKMTDINLKLITDIDMYQMVEIGLRGGVSYIVNRYSKPNNTSRKHLRINVTPDLHLMVWLISMPVIKV